jgi:isopenicillin-N epimerase
VARVPFPLRDAAQITAAVLASVSAHTKLALLDHVSSPTAIIFPIAELVRELRQRGVETLVDGAHAPGMIDLDVGAIDAAYYTGNCHKWICAPKGAGFLVVRRELQAEVRPAVISHGANSPRHDRSRYLLEFDWTGSIDPTAYLTIPAALRCMEEVGARFLPASGGGNGWDALRAHNHRLALAARDLLNEALQIESACPPHLLGSMATVPVAAAPTDPAVAPVSLDPLQDKLWFEHRIEVPVFPWPRWPRRWLRISAQAYNRRADYERLAAALRRR